MLRWISPIIGSLLGSVIALAIAGGLYRAVSQADDVGSYPALGRLVDICGVHLPSCYRSHLGQDLFESRLSWAQLSPNTMTNALRVV